MRGHGRSGRWLATAAISIAVLAFGLGLALHGTPLSEAANYAQLVSVIPLIAAMIGWLRARHGTKDLVHDRLARLGELLRLIADAQGLTGEDLRARLQDDFGSDSIDAYLSGRKRPGWDFIAAFLKVVERDDRWHREVLERQIRPVWEASVDTASRASGQGIGPGDEISAPTQPAPVSKTSQVPGLRRPSHIIPRLFMVAAASTVVVLGLLTAMRVFAGTGSYTWSHATGGPVASSPWAAGGSIYVGSEDGKVYALNAATGHVRWTYATNGPITSSPAVAVDTVYIGSQDGKVYALDKITGEVRWTYTTNGPVTSSPAVAAGTVYVGSQDRNVYALYAATGYTRWVCPTGGPVYSNPAVADGIVYIGSRDRRLYALDAATGHVIWTHATGSNVESGPAVAGGTVYVGSDDSKVYALSATTGRIRWTHTTGGPVYSSPAVVGSTVYIGSSDNKVYALNAATGS